MRFRFAAGENRRVLCPKRSVVWIGMFFLLAGSWLFVRNEGTSQAELLEQEAESLEAYASGEKDATEFLQNLVDSGKGNIVLPKGTFRISEPIIVDLDEVGWTSWQGNSVARIVMTGPGPAIHILGNHDGTAAPHTVKENVWSRERTPVVDGIEIVGEHPAACGIEATRTMQLTLTRVVVRNARHGIHLRERNRNVIVSECHLYDNSGVGLFLDKVNLHQINVTNSHISYNDGGGIVSLGSQIRNLQIGSCDIEGNMGGEESKPTANVWLDSSLASIGEVAIVGCTIQHTHQAPDSANIRINGLSKERSFTDERRHGHVTIADNILSDVQVNIELRHCRGVTVTGNTLWKAYAHNLVIHDCDQVVVGENVLDRNPRYHYGDGSEASLAVEVTDSEQCLFNDNIVQGAGNVEAVLTFRNCRNLQITDCSLTEYGKCGILCEDVSRSRIAGCVFEEPRDEFSAGVPLRLKSGRGNVVQDNLFDREPELNARAVALEEGNVVGAD